MRANTLGSKSVVAEVSQTAMELKLLIEQMREQIRIWNNESGRIRKTQCQQRPSELRPFSVFVLFPDRGLECLARSVRKKALPRSMRGKG